MRWFSGTAFTIAIFCALASPFPVSAQYVGTTAPLFPTLMVPMFPNGSTIPFSGQSARHAPSRAGVAPTVPTKATSIASGPSQVETNAADLATHFPPDSRTRMKGTYVQAFDAFKKFERKLGLPDNDIANGVSAYIAGNYMILHGVEIADPDFLKVVAQVRQGLLQNRGFQQVPAVQKRKLYEQTAMVGMFMAIAQLSRKATAEDAAAIRNLQNSAEANLELVLGTTPSVLKIDSEGMHL